MIVSGVSPGAEGSIALASSVDRFCGSPVGQHVREILSSAEQLYLRNAGFRFMLPSTLFMLKAFMVFTADGAVVFSSGSG